ELPDRPRTVSRRSRNYKICAASLRSDLAVISPGFVRFVRLFSFALIALAAFLAGCVGKVGAAGAGAAGTTGSLSGAGGGGAGTGTGGGTASASPYIPAARHTRQCAIALDEKHGEIHETAGRLDSISAGGCKWKRRARDLPGRARGDIRKRVRAPSAGGHRPLQATRLALAVIPGNDRGGGRGGRPAWWLVSDRAAQLGGPPSYPKQEDIATATPLLTP